MLLNRLKAEGVDVSDINVSTGRATGAAFVAYTSSGDREFIFHIDGTPSADISFTENAEIPDFFHIMGCSLTVNGHLKAESEKTCLYFSDRGAKISFDPNIRSSLLGERDIMEIVGTVMERCSIFLPGVDELMLVSGGRWRLWERWRRFLSGFPNWRSFILKRASGDPTLSAGVGTLKSPHTQSKESTLLWILLVQGILLTPPLFQPSLTAGEW